MSKLGDLLMESHLNYDRVPGVPGCKATKLYPAGQAVVEGPCDCGGKVQHRAPSQTWTVGARIGQVDTLAVRREIVGTREDAERVMWEILEELSVDTFIESTKVLESDDR